MFESLVEPIGVSTHAPLRQRGEPTPSAAEPGDWICFNPRPASSARRTIAGGPGFVWEVVSTHAPLRQRGERVVGQWDAVEVAVSTHAPLRQRGERFSVGAVAHDNMFQPTPRFVSEANSTTGTGF